MEQPSGSQWLKEPELEGVVDLIESGDLIKVDCDGCQLGYKDYDTGFPNCKPTTFITSMLAAESVFQSCKCPRTHQHLALEGSNSQGRRTAQAATCPNMARLAEPASPGNDCAASDH